MAKATGRTRTGLGGSRLHFSIGVCIAAGKDGIAYPIKTAKLGGTTLGSRKPESELRQTAAPPVWLTMSPGPVDPCPTDPRTLNFFPWGDTAHLHMTPVQFFDPVLNSWTIFAWGENSQLHKWQVSSTGKLTYVAQSHEYASDDVRETPPAGCQADFVPDRAMVRTPTRRFFTARFLTAMRTPTS